MTRSFERNLDRTFNSYYLQSVIGDVKDFRRGIKVSEADIYLEQVHTTGRPRWFTFEYEGFHWEGYVASLNEGKAKAWTAWLNKMKGDKP